MSAEGLHAQCNQFIKILPSFYRRNSLNKQENTKNKLWSHNSYTQYINYLHSLLMNQICPLTPEVTWATGHWSLLRCTFSLRRRSGSDLWPVQRSEFKVHSTTRVTYAHLTLSAGYSQTDEGKVITFSFCNAFIYCEWAKLVIMEEIVQGKILLCVIIIYEPYVLPDCGSVWQWWGFNQTQMDISVWNGDYSV